MQLFVHVLGSHGLSLIRSVIVVVVVVVVVVVDVVFLNMI